MERNLYDILGLEPHCSKIEVKSAYKKLAIKLHPDINPNDKEASNKFKRLTEAYRILSDDIKRKEYHDKIFAPKPHIKLKSKQKGANIFNIFNRKPYSYYQKVKPAHYKGLDIYQDIEISFIDSIKGTKQMINISNNKHLEVSIPAGVMNGTYLKLKGQGKLSADKKIFGDAYLRVNIKKHKHFSTDGLNIYLTLEISKTEAIFGKTLPIYTIADIVNITIPPNTKSGDIIKLKFQGIKKDASTIGDQIITIKVKEPREIFNNEYKVHKKLYHNGKTIYH